MIILHSYRIELCSFKLESQIVTTDLSYFDQKN
jgi:hypothetical protein